MYIITYFTYYVLIYSSYTDAGDRLKGFSKETASTVQEDKHTRIKRFFHGYIVYTGSILPVSAHATLRASLLSLL